MILPIIVLIMTASVYSVCNAELNESSKIDMNVWNEYIHVTRSSGQIIKYSFTASDTTFTAPALAETTNATGLLTMRVSENGSISIESWDPSLPVLESPISGLLNELPAWLNNIQHGDVPKELNQYSIMGFEQIVLNSRVFNCIKIGWNSAQGFVHEWYAPKLGLVKKQIEGNSASYKFRMNIVLLSD
jgi:hypothetical protein